MLVIRFNRFGKKNQSAFRIVLQEKTKAPGHRHVEMLGSYNPHTKVTVLKKERVLYWLSQGVQPSDRVHNLLVKEKVIEGKIIPKKMPRPLVKEEATTEKTVEAKAPEAKVEAVGGEPVEPKIEGEALKETPKASEVKAEVPKAPETVAEAPKEVKEEAKA